MEEITKREEEDLRNIFSVDKEEDIKDVKITKDGEQFAVKIPRDFAREFNINSNKDVFRFILMKDKDNNKKLHGELIKDGI